MDIKEAIVERFALGESVDNLARYYQLDRGEVIAIVQDAFQEQLKQDGNC